MLSTFIDPVFCKNIQKRFHASQESGCLQDLYDGREYRRHKEFFSCPNNVSFTINTDGAQVFKSSSISLWPIWLVVNELPPQVR